jgi:predicted ATP-binding protein involved in virulence
MKIRKLTLTDFRCFENFEMEFSDQYNVHVIIAENMVGKSGILAGLRLAANTYTSGLKIEKQLLKTDHRIYGNNPISDQSPDISIRATFSMLNSKNTYCETTFVKYKTKQEGERTKVEILDGPDPRKESKIVNKLVAEKKAIQPLFSFIGTEYIHLESSDTVDWDISGKSIDGYKGCFEDKSIKKFLFKWLGRMDGIIAEMSRKPLLAEQYKDIPQKAVEAFQKAVTSVLPDIQVIEWNSDLNQPTVKLANGDVRQFDVLSDGYRYLILLAGELATRSFILNKHLGDRVLEEIHGMVIIDEFGIHLHPSLQSNALMNLQHTFPNVQFIVSTHSPLLLNGLKREQVHIIQVAENNQRMVSHPDEDIVGMGANQILTDVFGLETTMDNQFLGWNDRYTELFNAKRESKLSEAEEIEFQELSKKLAPLRLDPQLQLTQEDPIVRLVKQKLEQKTEESFKSFAPENVGTNIEEQVSKILNDIFEQK